MATSIVSVVTISVVSTVVSVIVSTLHHHLVQRSLPSEPGYELENKLRNLCRRLRRRLTRDIGNLLCRRNHRLHSHSHSLCAFLNCTYNIELFDVSHMLNMMWNQSATQHVIHVLLYKIQLFETFMNRWFLHLLEFCSNILVACESLVVTFLNSFIGYGFKEEAQEERKKRMHNMNPRNCFPQYAGLE